MCLKVFAYYGYVLKTAAELNAKEILTQRSSRRESTLVNKNGLQTLNVFLQSVNNDPSQSITKETLRKELHAMNYFNLVYRKARLLKDAHNIALL